MNPRHQFIVLGLIAMSLILSLFFIRGNYIYNIAALVSLFIIACVMMFMPKDEIYERRI